MNSLLAGLRVIDLSRLLPAPFCTQYLAQLGAEVIKVEEPAGDYARGLSAEMFALVNRGKRSVVLDLKKPDDVETLKALVRDADVLVESFRPGVMDRLGCGYETLRALNPRLVYAALTGYGQTGPYRDRAGHDMNYLGYAGVLDQTGAAGGPPTISNVQIADLAGGGLTCALAVLAAVIGARSSGEGTLVDCAMLDGSLALQVSAATTLRTIKSSLPRGSDMLSGALPNYRLFETADGKHVAFGALELKFFHKFLQAAGRSDLMKIAPVPGPGGQPLHDALTDLFRTRTREQWEVLGAEADCCLSGIYTLEEALDNPQVQARGLWSNDAGGKPQFDFPVRFSNAQTCGGVAPKLGADTAQVLAGLK
ncbi:CaiB/BaiF CoA transferase family protein [Solimonas terrae]|uniref:CoA transferase n=1 Tax=Solimonas terrae TaxID=1396819 RepID=A0A6M2BPY4_9GAMM|nr:CaiB/BaiF CoA-transferase family protein [Solimonas terrae]NGY04275.1 CoA transferase [Solimonas terrae]